MALTGEYPAGVIQWGTGNWYHSAPWELFTTKSVTFNGPGISSASLTFTSPRRLVSLLAYNGGGATSTTSISCPGQATKSVNVASNTTLNIATDFTANCSPVTIVSLNGWYTNFDNFVVDEVSGSTPLPPATPPPATQDPTPPASNQFTITFDDRAGHDLPLTGEYPSGVIQWGTGNWYHSRPWELFTTKSVSFNGPSISSASLTFVSPRRLVSLLAYNGGGDSTTSISCPGQATRSVVVAGGTTLSIATNFTANCSPVTITSANGWYTNFDDFVVDQAP